MEGLAWRSDAELVQGIRRGDHEAFAQLIDRWFDEVLSSARAIVGDDEAAADVAIDTFHALWYHFGQLTDDGGFGPWALETSRTFAASRAAALSASAPGAERERHLVPVLLDPQQLRAIVDHGLELRGVPTDPGRFGRAVALVGKAGTTAGVAGEATTLMQVVGTAGSVPSGRGGVTGPARTVAAAGEPLEALDQFGAVHERAHRYEAPSQRRERGLNLAPPRLAAGAVATVALLIIAAVLWFTNRHDPAVAADGADAVASTTVPAVEPTAPTATVDCSAVTPAPAVTGAACPAPTTTEATTTEATTSTTAVATSESTSPSSTRAATTSTTRSTTTSVQRTTTTRGSTTVTTVGTTTSTSTTRPTSSTTATTTKPTTTASTKTGLTPIVGGPAGTATLGQ